MKSTIKVIRYIVGILFIFSGLVKANDPLGLAYKMQEFFEVWAKSGFLPGFMHWLNDYALAFSLIMITFEIVAGVAVLVGWRMKLFSWLLLILILFFTFLTAYAYLSGKFKSCGCFGDCIPITPKVSFIKDLILTVLILIIFRYRRTIKPAMSPFMSGATITTATLATIWFQWYVMKHLPVADCLPFKKGNSISEGMKIPAGAIPDSMVVTFVYAKEGQKVEFTADSFPDDFDEDVYTFENRYDKLVRKGNAEPAIKDFLLTTLSGTDTTDAILQNGSLVGLLFVKDQLPTGAWLENMQVLYTKLREKNIPFYAVSNNIDAVAPHFTNMPETGMLRSDVVPIKTAARANPTFYLLHNGTILNKWSYADLMDAVGSLDKLP